MTDSERERIRQAWKPVWDAWLGLEAARRRKDKTHWQLLNAIMGLKMALEYVDILKPDEEANNDC